MPHVFPWLDVYMGCSPGTRWKHGLRGTCAALRGMGRFLTFLVECFSSNQAVSDPSRHPRPAPRAAGPPTGGGDGPTSEDTHGVRELGQYL